MMESVKDEVREEVAIVGMSCRFPGASNLESYWQMMIDGVDAISEVPENRWNKDEFYSADPTTPAKMNTIWGGFLNDVESFDAGFFGITPREAEQMSPQQRILLEVVWESLEDAGIPPQGLAGSDVGTYIGVASMDYYNKIMEEDGSRVKGYTLTGNSYCIVANRLAYLFDFRGPSMAIDTACSSSLVAVDLACKSLLTHETDLAIAGGTQYITNPWISVAMTDGGFLAADGRCKTFDASADGYTRGEGVGAVVLKRLKDAQRDGDRIWAVIKGSAVNHDGRSNGLTAPNPKAQEEVLRRAYKVSGVDPKKVGYIEAHGTGTAIGDPIEVKALNSILGEGREKQERCLLGSVKTNIGHLEAAAGIAGLIKSTLIVNRGVVPPVLHFNKPNPLIDFENSPFDLVTVLTRWVSADERIAGVSSFGFGGTNCHVVIQQPPAVTTDDSEIKVAANGDESRKYKMLCLSAKTDGALEKLAQDYSKSLKEKLKSTDLAELCKSAFYRRSTFGNRLAVVGQDHSEMAKALSSYVSQAEQQSSHAIVAGKAKPRKIAYMFTGQGSQYTSMGKSLYHCEPVYKDSIDECDQLMKQYCGESLIDIMFNDDMSSELSKTVYTQPAIFSLQVSLVNLMRHLGLEPSVVLGHSVGEYAAMYAAGVLSLEEGFKAISARAKLMQSIESAGSMFAVATSPENVERYLEGYSDKVTIAAINGPSSIVLSGCEEALTKIVSSLDQSGFLCKRLNVSHAFHSPLMGEILEEFKGKLAGLSFMPPKVKLISNVYARELLADENMVDYLCDHIMKPVLFHDSVMHAQDSGVNLFLELGPKPVLTGMAKNNMAAGVDLVPTLYENQDSVQSINKAVAALYANGVELNWDEYFGISSRNEVQVVDFPTYPLQPSRLWVLDEIVSTKESSGRKAEEHPYLRSISPKKTPEGGVAAQIPVDTVTFPYLKDHSIFGVLVFPGAGYVELAQALGVLIYGGAGIEMKKVKFSTPFFVATEKRFLDLEFSALKDGISSFRFTSLGVNGEKVVNAVGEYIVRSK